MRDEYRFERAALVTFRDWGTATQRHSIVPHGLGTNGTHLSRDAWRK
jgi:hypothetical protein